MQNMRKEVHLTGKDLMGMVQLRPQDIGKYALVPGPKERLDAIVKKLQNPVKNFSFMEYNMYTGDFEGTKITAINGGRFSADTGITTEILCSAKAQTMLGYHDRIRLEAGVSAMAAWVKQHGSRVSKSFGTLEIDKNLPLSWRDPIA